MKKLLLLLLLLIPGLAQAQSIRGSLLDSAEKAPLVGANVILTHLPDSAQRYAIAGITGDFAFQDLEPGTYRLKTSYIGYQPLQRTVRVAEKDVNLGTLYLSAGVELQELEVTEQALRAIQKGDTTELNAGAYKANPDATAGQLLEKMPGIQRRDGKVQAQGEDVQEVLVNGRPFFGNDPNATLENIPAEMIDKVQVYDQKSEQAKFSGVDDGETRKTVNIITKPEYRNGTFGKGYGGYGTDERYKAGVVVNNFKEDRRITIIGQSNNINEQNFSTEDLAGVTQGGGGRGHGRYREAGASGDIRDFLVDQQGGITQTHAAGINYADKWGDKVEINASYFFNQSENASVSQLYREYLTQGDTGQVYTENQLSESQNTNHRLNLRLEYKINERNSILLRPSLSLQENSGSSFLQALMQRNAQLLSTTDREFNTDLSAWNLDNSILYRHRFEKRGRTLSLELEQEMNGTTGESELFATNSYFTESVFDTLWQEAELDQYERSYSADLRYTEPLSEKTVLELRYEPSVSYSEANQETLEFPSAQSTVGVLDTFLSNRLETQYLTQEGGVGLRYRGDKLMVMARANYQWAELSGQQVFPYEYDLERTFRSVLPSGFLRYEISDRQNLRIGYRSSTDAPSVDQLQAVLDNSNPLQLSIGNPELEQAYQHGLFARYAATNTEKNTSFFAMLFGSYVPDYIGRSTIISNSDTLLAEGILLQEGTQLERPVNLDGYFTVRSFANFGVPVGFLKSNLGLNASAGLSRTPGLLNDDLNYAWSPSAGLGITLSSNISENLDFTLSTESQMNWVTNTLGTARNSQYLSQDSRARLYWNIWKGLVYRTELNHQLYTGLTESGTDQYLLWNMSLGKKFLKDNRAELQLSVYDLLNQNNSFSRNITETYLEEVQTDVLQRYLMLTFTYNLRAFKGEKPGEVR